MTARLLLIDDDPADRNLVQHVLEQGRIEVELHEAPDGAAGVARAKGCDYDCALLDYRLPDECTEEVLRELVASGATQVILLTCIVPERLVLEMLETGAVDFVDKAEINTALPRAVRYALARRRYALERERLEGALECAHGLESIGRLASGIADGIDAPMRAVRDNVEVCESALLDLLRASSTFDAALRRAREGTLDESAPADSAHPAPADRATIARAREALPAAIAEISRGVAQIARIVQGLRDLAHAGPDEVPSADPSGVLERVAALTRAPKAR